MKKSIFLLIGLWALSHSLLHSQDVYIYDELGNKLCFHKADSTVQWTSNEIIVKIFSDANIEEVLNKHSIPYKNTRQLGSEFEIVN